MKHVIWGEFESHQAQEGPRQGGGMVLTLDASRIGHIADSPVIQLLEDQEWKACSLRSTMPSKVPSWNSEHGKTCTKDGDFFLSEV